MFRSLVLDQAADGRRLDECAAPELEDLESPLVDENIDGGSAHAEGPGLVDVVVVYKIDRLSRSLMDFSKLVEAFDRNGVTLVSVTQSFNTTTSMGRLTLNILLSFAQFEREVTAERIRDKIAASRAKGLFMGGNVPLGYVVKNRKLVVVEADAAVVRGIFERFVRIGSRRRSGVVSAQFPPDFLDRDDLQSALARRSGRQWEPLGRG